MSLLHTQHQPHHTPYAEDLKPYSARKLASGTHYPWREEEKWGENIKEKNKVGKTPGLISDALSGEEHPELGRNSKVVAGVGGFLRVGGGVSNVGFFIFLKILFLKVIIQPSVNILFYFHLQKIKRSPPLRAQSELKL